MNDKASGDPYSVKEYRTRTFRIPYLDDGNAGYFTGTASDPGSLIVNATGYSDQALNLTFALACAAYARPQKLRTDLTCTPESNSVIGDVVSIVFPTASQQYDAALDASDVTSDPPAVVPHRRDQGNYGYVQSITVAPDQAKNNVLITLADENGTALEPSYLLDGSSKPWAIPLMLEVLLWARQTQIEIFVSTTGYVNSGVGYIDEIDADPFSQR